MHFCCLMPLVIYFPTFMARYSLFVLKVPLNHKQTNKVCMTLSETQKLLTGLAFRVFGMSSLGDETHCSAMWWDSMTTRQLTAHYHRSQQQESAPVLVLVGGDGQDARAIHGSSRSATVHPSLFVLNCPRLGRRGQSCWRNGPLLSMRSDDDVETNKQNHHLLLIGLTFCYQLTLVILKCWP